MLTKEFVSENFFYKAFYLIGCIQLFWETYFSGFCFMDCAIISTGIAYQPKTDK